MIDTTVIKAEALRARLKQQQDRPDWEADRGTHYTLWTGGFGHTRWASFSPVPNVTDEYTISVPIGWTLQPVYAEGVVLVHTNLDLLLALDALDLALAGRRGFCLVQHTVLRRTELD